MLSQVIAAGCFLLALACVTALVVLCLRDCERMDVLRAELADARRQLRARERASTPEPKSPVMPAWDAHTRPTTLVSRREIGPIADALEPVNADDETSVYMRPTMLAGGGRHAP